MDTDPAPRNPKRNPAVRLQSDSFPYYAGYNPEFVSDVLDRFALPKGATVLDPWNGGGTTTTTAFRRGVDVVGFDINPVMVVVAKSALLDAGVLPSISPLAEELKSLVPATASASPYDPLTTWFAPASAAAIRGLSVAIWHVLVAPDQSPTAEPSKVSGLSTLASYFIVALFRTTRSFIRRFTGSNPTWVRDPEKLSQRVRPDAETVYAEFRRQLAAMERALVDTRPVPAAHGQVTPRYHVAVASSTDLR